MHDADATVEQLPGMASPSVSVLMCYRVREGAEEEFDHWLRDLSWCEMNAEGNCGVVIERKLIADSLEYHVESRFSSDPSLTRWLDSDKRRYWLAKLARTTVEPPQVEAVSHGEGQSAGEPTLLSASAGQPPSDTLSSRWWRQVAKAVMVCVVLLIQAI